MVKKTTPERLEPVGADDTSAPRLANPELPYAQIEYATNNSLLYPVDALEGTVATITVTGMQAAPVTLYWSIKGQEKPTFDPIVEPGDTSGSVKIDIPWQYVSTCIGHTVLIWYTATVGGRVKESLVLELEIQDVREEHLRGSLPVFKHARANSPTDPTVWLRMNEFVGDELVYFKAWPMIQAGQRLFLTVAGDQHVVPYQFIWVAMDHTVTEEEAHPDHVFVFPLRRGWMSRRQGYSALTSHLGVIWDGTEPNYPQQDDPVHENPLPINAQDFHLRTTTLLMVDPGLDLPPPNLRESVIYFDEWLLNPDLTKDGGHVDAPDLKTYAGDEVCFYVSGPEYETKSLGCVTIQNDGERASVKLLPCIVACFFDKPMTLSYTVKFPNADEPQQSPERVVNVLVPEFPCPDIAEATNGTVDLRTFSTPAKATVPIWAYADCSKCCWMWATGKDEKDETLRFDILKGEPIKDEWKTDGVDTSVLRVALQKLADCEDFELHFAASFCESCDWADAHEFSARTFRIAQEAMVLLAPKVTEAVGTELTPWNARNGLHVEVDYPGNSPKHTISVCWENPDGSCWPLAANPGSATGAVIFQLPAEAVIQRMGTTVSITYTVTTKCKVQTSLPLNLKIKQPEGLETPNILEATPPRTNGAILSLRTFPNHARSLEDTMWFLRAGQKCWLRAVGTNKNNVPYSFTVYAARTITEAEVTAGVANTVLRAELEKAKNNSTMVFTFSVQTNGSSDESNAVVCPSRSLKMNVPFYDYTDFDPAGKGWNNWKKGPGAADARDLVLKQGAVPGSPRGNFLQDLGFTNTSNPATQRVKLYKDFTELEVGLNYRFSAMIRDAYAPGTGRKPGMILVAGGKDITPKTEPGTAWQLLQGTFKASSTVVRLSIDNLHMGIDPINDFDVTQITVQEN